ncbi:hypothetical protein CXB51_016569 [Gossypium anomalum]|uniref:Reverse transcriptase Ty1/copia-type domain-containing protein n=1 Tax=Gossypium anomalum TaxID=47600 RepID=A0A8J6D226_9ROSI|nr:hypothetical protein CXB51_016569 [Gossypium anomalum]
MPFSNNPLTQPPQPACVPSNSHPMVTRSKARIFKPKAYMSTVTSISEHTPADIHKAMANESWKATVHMNKKADGSVDRYKARLVAKGFSQHDGVDFQDTFSPMVRAATIRTILAIAVMKWWPLRQVDVNNTFLNRELTEEIYMNQPPGFEETGPNGQKLVRKLNKVLHGLRQAPRAWFQTLKQYLVDDIVITGSSSKEIDSVGLFLNQKKYITEILHKTGMTEASAIPTPMVNVPKLVAFDGNPPFADGHIQYMNSPSDSHWKAVKRVLRYLLETIDHGLYLSKGPFELVCYSGADWASSVEDRHSSIGYVVYLGQILSHGAPKSNQLYPGLHLKQSIEA